MRRVHDESLSLGHNLIRPRATVEKRRAALNPQAPARPSDSHERCLSSTQGRRFLGAVAGAMIGEALGRRVAAMTIEEIRERYGESGITSMEPAAEDQHMSAYMAMLAVSLDGRVRLERALASGLDPIAELRAAYELWSSKGEVP